MARVTAAQLTSHSLDELLKFLASLPPINRGHFFVACVWLSYFPWIKKDFWMEDFKDVRNQIWNSLFPQVWTGCLKNPKEHESFGDGRAEKTFHCFKSTPVVLFPSYVAVFLSYSEFESCQQHFANRWFNWTLRHLSLSTHQSVQQCHCSEKNFLLFSFFWKPSLWGNKQAT